ncbi:MAG: hypothetical protein M0Z45_02740 [Actinomycetota bacterium]|nr:hypothetical protein [Actinomycetota bacterium]
MGDVIVVLSIIGGSFLTIKFVYFCDKIISQTDDPVITGVEANDAQL